MAHQGPRWGPHKANACPKQSPTDPQACKSLLLATTGPTKYKKNTTARAIHGPNYKRIQIQKNTTTNISKYKKIQLQTYPNTKKYENMKNMKNTYLVGLVVGNPGLIQIRKKKSTHHVWPHADRHYILSFPRGADVCRLPQGPMIFPARPLLENQSKWLHDMKVPCSCHTW